MAVKIKQPAGKLTVMEEGVTAARGFHAGGLHCGMRRKRKDLGWLFSEVPATASAVYTTNLFQAAPLQVTKETIAAGKSLQGLIVNSAVANACTGEEGLQNAYQMRHWFAEKMGLQDYHVAVNSTGVIGEQLPMHKIRNGIDQITLDMASCNDFNQAILTTDTFTKTAYVQLVINEKTVTIGGSAKGSGMINPNMATMLAFVTTDAAIETEALDHTLRTTVNKTFNAITVDGDTSTNDTVMVMANGMAGNQTITMRNKEDLELFQHGLSIVCKELAKQIARDGEGATKLVEVYVKGCQLRKNAQAIGKSIVGSSLVKTAIFGADVNWGRIICAAGYSGIPFNTKKVSVSLGDIEIVRYGLPLAFDEPVVQNYLKHEKEIHITVDLNEGQEEAYSWGCDLSYEYVRINASYRT
ncbi:bifunctional glutamate N-acetyltransferase/amino-acid acetyltransferase ArgJ [Virgibacillus siamensis]|uniref:bifunctional glutamate N-acetyltransferase/amino-acid acetyltransferase ArgJ n=1 Tax=Virgibacillus siamensis TaxID=480071 RepID=UPI00098718EA|nr:bifunctional glutamate N-acetyltransferase/amino-acid acetyltransferase ArgJ [Virgibacillus siamensis]